MVAPPPEHFFLPIDNGQRFCSFHAPGTPAPVAAVLYLHPLAEEANKSRRMAALQSRALAAAGCAVLQVDLLGCGDSSGDSGDASWDAWLHDATIALAALRARAQAPAWLWGLRTGALLASAVAAHSPGLAGLLMWQPVVSGRTALQQMLRLRSAGDALGSGSKGVVAGLRAELAAGRPVDVAGYSLSPALAFGLEQASLQAPPPVPRVAWLEVAVRAGAQLLPASVEVGDRWRAAGIDVCSEVAHGPAFWQTTEIEEAPALINASCRMLMAHSEPCAA
jgi:uncharacterized protein